MCGNDGNVGDLLWGFNGDVWVAVENKTQSGKENERHRNGNGEQRKGCFPQGTTLTLTNMKLIQRLRFACKSNPFNPKFLSLPPLIYRESTGILIFLIVQNINKKLENNILLISYWRWPYHSMQGYILVSIISIFLIFNQQGNK